MKEVEKVCNDDSIYNHVISYGNNQCECQRKL